MLALRVTSRRELAALWLPWCVARRDRRQLIRIADEPDRRDEAMHRVDDLDDDQVRAALSTQQVRDDGSSSLDVIGERASDYVATVLAGQTVAVVPTGRLEDDPAAFATSDGPMLHEASHRACALYEAVVKPFELRARVDPLFGGWRVYDDPRLRRR